MKILLITVLAVTVAVCYCNPAGYNAEFEAHRLANLKMTQELANESLKPLSIQEHYPAHHAPGRSNRNEYRIFGKDAISLNSGKDISAASQDNKTNGGSIQQIHNTELQDAFSLNENEFNNFSSTSGTAARTSSFYQQDLRSDLPYEHSPDPEVQTFSSQETRRPGVTENHSSKANIKRQGIFQKGTPHSSDHSTGIQTGIFSLQDIRKPVEDHAFTIHRQETGQTGAPFALNHRSRIQSGEYGSQSVSGRISDLVQDQSTQAQRPGFQSQGVYETNRYSTVDQLPQSDKRTLNQNGKNIFGSRFDDVQEQISQRQRAEFQRNTQDTLKAADVSIEDPNSKIFSSQNGMRQRNAINQDQKYLIQNPHALGQGQIQSQEPAQYQHFLQEDQVKSSQELGNQYQHISQQGQIKSSQEPTQYQHLSQQGKIKSLLDQENQYHQGQTKSSEQPKNQHQHFSQQGQIQLSLEQRNQYQQNHETPLPVSILTENSFDQKPNGFESHRISGSRRPVNQNKYASTFVQYPNNQQKENLRGKGDVFVASSFKDDSNKQDGIWKRKHDVETRTKDVAQGPFRVQSGQKTVFNEPQFGQDHSKSDFVSGSKGGPIVLHKTSGVATSHAVVIGRDSGTPGKGASLSQHLKTPYAHYTYSHRL